MRLWTYGRRFSPRCTRSCVPRGHGDKFRRNRQLHAVLGAGHNSAELKGPPQLFVFGWFGVDFRPLWDRLSAKIGPGTVTDGPGLKNAAGINDNHLGRPI